MKLPSEVISWNSTYKQYPLDRTMLDIINEQISESIDVTAVVFDETEVTYAELNRRANKVAAHIRGLGATENTFVGVFMERSVEMVVALLGILKAGAAYVPFDPEYPKDRLDYMFEDSAVKILLTQRKFKNNRFSEGLQCVYLDDQAWSITEEKDDTSTPVDLTPESAIYMIYTSGSTGKPKGVVNIHAALVNRLFWMQEAFQLVSGERVLQKTPYSFDVSVWEFFWPLMVGATIVMARPGGHKDNQYLVEAIKRYDVSTLHFVPSMLSLFLTSINLQTITSLKRVICSGEALPFELSRRFFNLLKNVELHNLYGPTEAAIDVTHWACSTTSVLNIVPIGKPIANIRTYILDEQLNPVAIGDEGELHLAGVGLAREYWNRPELTAEKFVKDPFVMESGERMYKTGDLARYLPDGNIEYLGRIDNQIKLRGFRIELGEIEAALLMVAHVREAAVVASSDSLEDRKLIAYLVCDEGAPDVSALRLELLKTLPDYMVPARFVYIQQMPLTPNGKVDRKSLAAKSTFSRPALSVMYVAPSSPTEIELCALWQRMLSLEKVGVKDNFFDLGGNSILAVRMANEVQELFNAYLPVVKIFEYGNIEKLAAFLDGDSDDSLADVFRIHSQRLQERTSSLQHDSIAVVGMAGRFPGAENLEELWKNLCDGIESISTFDSDELDSWVDEETRQDPNYVPCRGILQNADLFDHKFFGIGPLEAKVMDPQQRVFLELAWAALENAGYTDEFKGMIGVYAGVGDNHYYSRHVLGHKDLIKTVGDLIVGYGNEKDYIATRVSYALNLTGPSVSANTGCSTSLLAVDHAFKALNSYECDMALAGGVDIHAPQKTGQTFTEGGTFTKDGHCRPFDMDATGTMFSDGAGIVVLKRLKDAINDGDQIYSVIRSVAKNNDGANKVSFLAPSVEGQAQVIALTHAQAGISADSISYVEAHGTGTPLGDPIEIEGLTKAFKLTTDHKQFCYIGSVKGNIGHPTIASGIAGFIKATLALYYEQIPATLHFNKPNPRIDFENTPFKVVSKLTPWKRCKNPRRAGVSSFGFGGTNVHAILEEAPPPQSSSESIKNNSLLMVSAKTSSALQRNIENLADFLAASSGDTKLSDIAYTLQVGRKHFGYRQFVVSKSVESAAELLRAVVNQPVREVITINPHITFMFPGQGSQYINMGRDLYNSSELFRRTIDKCCDLLLHHLDRDLRELLFPAPGDEDAATASLKDTYYTQPALFTIEYSLAVFWMSMGVQPKAFIGHSVGEFVGACLSGVMSLEDALPLVALRAKLVRSMPRGTMLSVRCSAEAVEPRLNSDVQLAAENGPNLCVVAGPHEAIDQFRTYCEKEGIVTRELHTSHAFHSAMMDPVVNEFTQAVSKIKLNPPRIPVLSTCTADWMTADQATSPAYWGQHLRNAVRFSPSIKRIIDEKDGIFLEVGPRDVLATLARQQAVGTKKAAIIASLANSGKDEVDDEWTDLNNAIGALWGNGCVIDWIAYYIGEHRSRVALPTYSFEPSSHWLEPILLTGTRESTFDETDVEQTLEDRTELVGERNDKVFDVIADMVKEIVGAPLQPEDENLTFVMLGADSLASMQMARMIKNKFGFEVTFRQLIEKYTTPRILAEALKEFLGENAPDEAESQSMQTENTDGAQKVELSHLALSQARIGRDENNNLAWFIPANDESGKYFQIIVD